MKDHCDDCGQPHPRCNHHVGPWTVEQEAARAAKYPNGRPHKIEPVIRPCAKGVVPGTDLCRSHGGEAPQVKAKAKERIEKAKAEAAVATFGLPVNVDPDIALIDELARTHGHVIYLQAIIAELKQAELVFGVTSYEQGIDKGQDVDKTTYSASINIWVQLYQLERKHLTEVAKAMLAAGFKEREVRLVERQGQLIADVLRAMFGDPELGLSPQQEQQFRRVASRHLRAIDGGKTA